MDERELLKLLGLIDDNKGDDNDKQGVNDDNQQTQPTQQQKDKQTDDKQIPNDNTNQPTQQQTQEPQTQQQTQQYDFNQVLKDQFKMITGQEFDPTNPQHIVAINQLAQQLQKQQEVMNYLHSVVSPEFDNWLNEKIKTLPFNDVYNFQLAIQNGDINGVKQFIERMKKEWAMEKSNYKQVDDKELPRQSAEKNFSEYGEGGDELVDLILSDFE